MGKSEIMIVFTLEGLKKKKETSVKVSIFLGACG